MQTRQLLHVVLNFGTEHKCKSLTLVLKFEFGKGFKNFMNLLRERQLLWVSYPGQTNIICDYKNTLPYLNRFSFSDNCSARACSVFSLYDSSKSLKRDECIHECIKVYIEPVRICLAWRLLKWMRHQIYIYCVGKKQEKWNNPLMCKRGTVWESLNLPMREWNQVRVLFRCVCVHKRETVPFESIEQ